MKNVNSDLAYAYLRKRILSGEYAPGHALMTNLLAPEIGVSRTPIRDALRQLEAEGLVTIQPRLGASVKKMDLKSFRESCEVRLALESHAAALAARHHAGVELHEIELALDEMRRITKDLARSGSRARLLPMLVREDVRFHVAIIGAAKNDLMKKEILRLHLINRVVAGPVSAEAAGVRASDADETAHRQQVLSEHEEIFRAIGAGEAEQARRAMAQHIQNIIDRTVARFARANPDAASRPLSEDESIYSP